MSSNTAISVIVPVYNSEKYLSQCIDSILAQTFTDFELLLIDDGSMDRSGEICENYAERDPRIIVIHQKNAGASAARNRGIELARGTYIMFIDSDDYVDLTFLEYAYISTKKSNADLYISGLVLETFQNSELVSQSIYTAKREKEYSLLEMLEDIDITYPAVCIYGPCCKLFKRELIQYRNLKFQEDLNYMEDLQFNLEVLSFTNRIFFSDKVYYHYRRGNDNSLTLLFNPGQYDMIISVYGQLKALIWKMNCSERVKSCFSGIFFTGMASQIVNYFSHYEQTTSSERKELLDKIAANPNVKNLSMREVETFRQKMIFIFLKLRMTGLLAKLLDIYYQRGRLWKNLLQR